MHTVAVTIAIWPTGCPLNVHIHSSLIARASLCSATHKTFSFCLCMKCFFFSSFFSLSLSLSVRITFPHYDRIINCALKLQFLLLIAMIFMCWMNRHETQLIGWQTIKWTERRHMTQTTNGKIMICNEKLHRRYALSATARDSIIIRVIIWNLLKWEMCRFYLQSRLIPTAKHFLKRQYWQRFRFSRITRHLPSRKQRYSICFWMLRRKNPCNGKEWLVFCWLLIRRWILHKLCILRMMWRRNDSQTLCRRTLCKKQMFSTKNFRWHRSHWLVGLQQERRMVVFKTK